MKWSFHWKNYVTGYLGIYFSLERTSEYLVEEAILFRTTSLLQIFGITMLSSRVIFKVKSCCKNHSMTLIKIYRWHGKLMKEIIFKRWISDRIIINYKVLKPYLIAFWDFRNSFDRDVHFLNRLELPANTNVSLCWDNKATNLGNTFLSMYEPWTSFSHFQQKIYGICYKI